MLSSASSFPKLSKELEHTSSVLSGTAKLATAGQGISSIAEGDASWGIDGIFDTGSKLMAGVQGGKRIYDVISPSSGTSPSS